MTRLLPPSVAEATLKRLRKDAQHTVCPVCSRPLRLLSGWPLLHNYSLVDPDDSIKNVVCTRCRKRLSQYHAVFFIGRGYHRGCFNVLHRQKMKYPFGRRRATPC